MQELVITIDGAPVPKQRPRVVRKKDGGSVFGFTPKRTRDYERRVHQAASQSLMRWRSEHKTQWPSSSRFSVSMFFFMPDHRTRDLDNCVKSVTDAINGTVFDDDRQIDELYAVRDHDKENPRAIVVIRPL